MPNIKSIPLKTKELRRYAIGTPWIRHIYANGHAIATPLAYARDSPIPQNQPKNYLAAPQFLPNFWKISLFASNFSISMPTAPSRSSHPPHFQIHSAIYAHLNRIHQVVVQIKIIFFPRFHTSDC